jgi:SAM-dependent methyltransferase
LVAIAGASLVLAPARAADLRSSEIPEVLNLLGILILTIGLPAFLLTTTTPLVSAWYASTRAKDREGGDAYWLYALSNTGSLLALLAYPFVIEPRLGLVAQRGIWAIGFVLFGVAIAACAAWTARHVVQRIGTGTESEGAIAGVTWRRRLRWLLLAAVPSGLLSAVTTFVATDLVSAPLLWLGPLAIYLVTFIVAFSARGRRVVPIAAALAPAAVTLMWVPYGSAAGWPILPLVVLMYGGLAIVATALHGRLALDRPEPARLTEFYLVISIGGALASASVALVAPILFPGVWEFPILLVLALVALAVTGVARARGSATAAAFTPRPGIVDLTPFLRGARGRLGPYLIVAGLLIALLVRDTSLGAEAGVRWLLVGGLILLVGARPAFLAVSTGLVLALAVLALQPAAIFRDRSFFGVTEVLRPEGASRTTLVNGTTVHGIQSTDPALASIPQAYYARPGPLGDLFRVLASDGAPHDVAAVGLGAGAVATYLEPGWSMTFFEIDPLVAEVASDPRYFTYLSGAVVPPRIVLGDARLSLRDVPDATYDAVVVDAFSSDAIPTHLLTTEAMTEYVRVLRPGGLVLVHISNRYYDLGPAVAAVAGARGLKAERRVYVPTEVEAAGGATTTDAVIVSSSKSALDTLAASGWWRIPATVAPMTDDFMDILRFLRPLW